MQINCQKVSGRFCGGGHDTGSIWAHGADTTDYRRYANGHTEIAERTISNGEDTNEAEASGGQAPQHHIGNGFGGCERRFVSWTQMQMNMITWVFNRLYMVLCFFQRCHSFRSCGYTSSDDRFFYTLFTAFHSAESAQAMGKASFKTEQSRFEDGLRNR